MSISMTRNLDSMWRIVIPKETRDALDIPAHTPLEFWLDGNTVILKKYGCAICGGQEGLVDFKGQRVCETCRAELASVHTEPEATGHTDPAE